MIKNLKDTLKMKRLMKMDLGRHRKILIVLNYIRMDYKKRTDLI